MQTINDLQRRLQILREQYSEGHVEAQRLKAQISQLERELETERARVERSSAAERGPAGGKFIKEMRPSGRTIIDTSFTMEIGETVVVGTSRLKGDKALIALLTAVASTKTPRAERSEQRRYNRRMPKRCRAAKRVPAPSKSAADTRRIMAKLETQHPNADTELHFSNAYELLVATILSAQCTDERVNQVTPALFKRYPDAAALAQATTAELEPQIQSTGFFRAKSRSLLGMATAVVEQHARRGAEDDGRAGRAARRRPQDRQRRPRSRARRARPAGRSPRAARREPDRHRAIRRSGGRRAAAVRRDAAGGVDAHVRHADPARPPHLQAAAAVRQVRGARRLRLLPSRASGVVAQRQAARRRVVEAKRPQAEPVAAIARSGRRRRPSGERREERLAGVGPHDKSSNDPRAISRARRGGAPRDSPALPRRDEERRRRSSRTSRRRTSSRRWRSSRRDSLFGLYQGTPLPERGWGYGNALPDRISIYQRPIEEACEDDEEIRDCVAETVIHEFGHYFGMDEEQIEEIEEKYWRGESLDDDLSD